MATKVNLGGSVGVKSKKKKKSGGTIVPVGGETAQGMYSGATGELIKAAPKQKYVVAKRDNSGNMTYSPGFSVLDGATLKRPKNSVLDTENYTYKNLDRYTTQGSPSYSRETIDMYEEAKRQSQEEDSNLWSLFKRDAQPVINAAMEGFSTITGWLEPIMQKMDEYIYNPRNRVIGAAAAAINPSSSAFIGDGHANEQWQKAWDGTYGLHYGQSLAQLFPWAPGSPMSGMDQVRDENGNMRSDLQFASEEDRRVAEEKFQYDPAVQANHDRIRAWSENDLGGKYASLEATGFVEFLLDPLVLAGKVAKLGKGVMLGRTWAGSLGKSGAIKMIDNAVALTNGEALAGIPDSELVGMTAKQVKKVRATERKAAARAESTRRIFTEMAGEKRSHMIEQHELVKNSTNPQAFASMIADTDTVEEVAEIFRYTLGDDAAAARLAQTKQSVSVELMNARAWQDSQVNWRAGAEWDANPKDFQKHLDSMKFNDVFEEKAYVKGFVDDLARREEKLGALLESTVDITGQGIMSRSGISRSATIESIKINRARARGEAQFVTQVFSKNVFSVPVRTVRWLGAQRPSGWIPISGISDVKSAGESMVAWLRTAKVLTPAERASYYDQYTRAVAQGDQAVLGAVQGIEYDIMVKHATEYAIKDGRIPPKPKLPFDKSSVDTQARVNRAMRDGEIAPSPDDVTYNDAVEGRWTPSQHTAEEQAAHRLEVEAWEKQVNEFIARDEVMQGWSREARKWQRRRDGASKILGDRGGYYIDDDGSLVLIPGYETQLAGAMPLMDWGRFSDAAKDTLTLNGNNSIATVGNKAKYGLLATNYAFQRLYRPLILLSLKYTPRNLFDGILRNVATTGGATFDPNILRAGFDNAMNRSKKAKVYGRGHTRKDLERAHEKIREDLYSAEGSQAMADVLRADLETLDLDIEDQKAMRDLLGVFDYNAKKKAQAHQLNQQQKIDEKLAPMEQRRADLDSQLQDLDTHIADKEGRLQAIGEDLDTLNTKRVRGSDYGLDFQGVKFEGLTGADKAIPPEVILNNFSAQETMSMVYSLRANARERAYRKQFGYLNGRVSQSADNYYDELGHFFNRVLRGSKLAKLRLEDVDDSDFVKFFHSQEGQPLKRFAKEIGLNLDSRTDIVTWYREGMDSLHAYFPDESIRNKILTGEEVTVNELREKLSKYDLPDVVGYEIATEHGVGSHTVKNSIGQSWDKFTSHAFNLIGNIPESNIARYPLGSAMYQRHLSELVQFHGADYARRNVDKLMRQAERRALRDVKETQYTVERYSNLASIFEPIAPFFQAQINTVRTWAKIVGNDPSVLARAMQLWDYTKGGVEIPVGEIANADVPVWSNIMDATGMSDVREDAKYEITPQKIAQAMLSSNSQIDALMAEDGKTPETTLQSLLIGQIMPQFGGPWVSPMSSEILKGYQAIGDPNFAQEFLVDLASYVSPYGADNGPLPFSLGTLTPAVYKDMLTAWQGMDSDTFAATTSAVFRSMQVDYMRRGAVGEPPSWEEAKKQAHALFLWDAMFHFGSPFSGFERHDEYTPVRDAIKAAYDQGKDGAEVRQMVYDKFGFDYAPLLMASQDKFGGVPATMAAVKWLKSNEDLVERFLAGSTSEQQRSERMSQLQLIVPELKYGPYEQQAAALLRTMNVPGDGRQYFDADRNAVRLESNIDVSRGWEAFNQVEAVHKSELSKLDSAYQTKKKDQKYYARRQKLENSFEKVLNTIKDDFKGWAEETQMLENSSIKPNFALGIIENVRSNPKLGAKLYATNPEYWATVDKFLEIRHATMVNVSKAGNLKDAYSQESKNSRLRVREVLQDYTDATNELRWKNTKFDQMFKSFFVSEIYSRDKYGEQVGPVIPYKGRWIPRAWTPNQRKKAGLPA